MAHEVKAVNGDIGGSGQTGIGGAGRGGGMQARAAK